MESPLLVLVSRLDLLDVAILMAAGCLLIYCVLSNRLYAVMFMLVLSASLVGTTIPVIEGVASLVRWLSLLLLLFTGLLFSRVEMSVGLLLFWGYVFLGLVSMFRAISITWQFQRGLLLLLVAAAISIGVWRQILQDAQDDSCVDCGRRSAVCGCQRCHSSEPTDRPGRFAGIRKALRR